MVPGSYARRFYFWASRIAGISCARSSMMDLVNRCSRPPSVQIDNDPGQAYALCPGSRLPARCRGEQRHLRHPSVRRESTDTSVL